MVCSKPYLRYLSLFRISHFLAPLSGTLPWWYFRRVENPLLLSILRLYLCAVFHFPGLLPEITKTRLTAPEEASDDTPQCCLFLERSSTNDDPRDLFPCMYRQYMNCSGAFRSPTKERDGNILPLPQYGSEESFRCMERMFGNFESF